MLLPVVTTLLGVAFVVASPVVIHESPVTLAQVRRLNLTGTQKLVEADQIRARYLRNHARSAQGQRLDGRAVFPVPLTNVGTGYTIQARIGNPATTYTLLVDIGTAVTWIGAEKPYQRTETSQDTGHQVTVSTGSGSFIGEGFLDTITLGNMTVVNQFIAVAPGTFGFSGFDGVLGIGPSDLAEFPTVTANAWAQHLLTADEIGISFEPTTSLSVTNGVLSFGGVDSDKFTGTLNSIPITSTSPSSEFVGIDESITYGAARSSILPITSGIVDTGTTLVLIATDALKKYQAATGAVLDENTGLLQVTAAQYANLDSLFFNIGGIDYEFTKNAQIWPRALNTAIGGEAGSIYLIINDIGSPSGEGLDFINGYTFLERFYMVYNSAVPSFEIATTAFTFATTN